VSRLTGFEVVLIQKTLQEIFKALRQHCKLFHVIMCPILKKSYFCVYLFSVEMDTRHMYTYFPVHHARTVAVSTFCELIHLSHLMIFAAFAVLTSFSVLL